MVPREVTEELAFKTPDFDRQVIGRRNNVVRLDVDTSHQFGMPLKNLGGTALPVPDPHSIVAASRDDVVLAHLDASRSSSVSTEVTDAFASVKIPHLHKSISTGTEDMVALDLDGINRSIVATQAVLQGVVRATDHANCTVFRARKYVLRRQAD